MQTTVFCKTKYEGIHRYPGAPLAVEYLSKPHRHIFGVKVEMDVFSDDREVEFIMLKHKVNAWLRIHFNSNDVWEMGALSCEQVATQLLKFLQTEYPVPYHADQKRRIIVTVDEDGENGAVVYGD